MFSLSVPSQTAFPVLFPTFLHSSLLSFHHWGPTVLFDVFLLSIHICLGQWLSNRDAGSLGVLMEQLPWWLLWGTGFWPLQPWWARWSRNTQLSFYIRDTLDNISIKTKNHFQATSISFWGNTPRKHSRKWKGKKSLWNSAQEFCSPSCWSCWYRCGGNGDTSC